MLDLSRNELKVLPESIGGLEKLEELNVSSNLLESLLESIGRLQNLKVLNATGNKLIAKFEGSECYWEQAKCPT
ncbi:hypothetical protein C1H46_012875 [Malus baccata]|uniref:Leucine-rich repeat-containing N-terminal plant-type domain-containing protein n=1 Tax=Malus baccata TaxID=106549 RepID=A0A540MRV6_MALBA|nr:hypothetical protein C1H46_012875 [Malus baccata]